MMKLHKDKRPEICGYQFCIGAQHTGPKMFKLNEGFADLDGEPFKAYYCRACAVQIAPEQVHALEVQ